jgi:hypothetical protein
MGSDMGLRGSNLALLAMLGPVVEKTFGYSLGEALAEAERQRQRQEEMGRQRSSEILVALTRRDKQTPDSTTEKTKAAPLLAPGERLEKERDGKWREVIVRPAVVLILGRRGSGKSGLGHRLLELFRYESAAYALGVPGQARKLLPDWIGVAQSLEDIPPKSVVLIDEAYLRYHSRDSLSRGSKEMSRIVNLSRQRSQTLVFVSQESGQIDKNIASSASVVVFKDLGILQLEFERQQFARIAADAKEAFAAVAGDKRKWSYVYSPDSGFMGLLENSLPTLLTSHILERRPQPYIRRRRRSICNQTTH